MRPSNNLENKTLSDILKKSASMYESSGSQFFRATIGIQSGPDTFDESRSWELQIFILVESSRLEFLGKYLANNFTLSDAENNTSRLLNRGGIAALPLLRPLLATRQNSQESSFWEVMYSSLAASSTLLQSTLLQ